MHAANLRDFLTDPTLDEWTRQSISEVLDRLTSDDYALDTFNAEDTEDAR